MLQKLVLACLISLALGKPQQSASDIDRNIADVFGTQNGAASTAATGDGTFGGIFSTSTQTPRRGGFGVIVQPEPEGPTLSPQTFQQQGETCLCVPYHRCDPTTNRTIEEDGTEESQGSFDGFGVIDVRFDRESCQDVLDVCCVPSKQTEKPIVPPVKVEPGRPTGCGLRNVGGIDFKLAGNTNEAGFGEFPWTCALINIANESCVCGGSLIHPNVVLTGAHCVKDFAPRTLKIRAGEWDTQTTKERLPYQERVVTRIVSHPDYSSRSLANDVALLLLESPVQLDDHINVVCLPNQGTVPSSKDCVATGWGKTVFGKQGKYSVIMKKIPLPIVQFNQCEKQLQATRLGAKFKLHHTFVCAGGILGVDTCEGDGGAPLTCPVGPANENRYTQSGIVAWGIGCNDVVPAVYAHVGLFRTWIDGQVRNFGYDPSVYSYN